MAEKVKPTKAWYSVPVLFGFLGGLIGYFAVKKDDQDLANKLLITGIVTSVVCGAIWFYFMMLLALTG